MRQANFCFFRRQVTDDDDDTVEYFVLVFK